MMPSQLRRAWRLDGQEGHADAVFAGGREGEAEFGAFAREVTRAGSG